MRIGRISLLFGFAFLSATLGYSQGPAFEWVVSIGASATFSGGYGVGHDDLGNVYVAGRFTGTADFDPGPGTNNLTSAGALDTYITKVDAGGNLVWARRVGGTLDDYSFDVFIDNSGSVYVTGAFAGTADFDPGPGTFNLSSAGSFEDIFVLKLDANGNLAWARKMGSSDFDFGRSITVSAAGNVFITGNFRGTVDFDPGSGTSFLTSVSGGNDIFISKLDAAGNFVWAKQLGGTGNDIGYAVTVDAAENVFTTGSFSATADFDPGTSVFNLTQVNNGDIFISKLDGAGNFVWAKGMGGTSSDIGYGVQVDDAGNVYTTGYFENTADFDPGPGTASLVSAGFNDAFICKLDVNGNYLWAKGMGGTIDDESSGLALDDSGNVYATGSFQSTVDFDPGPGIFNLTTGGSDGFVVKLNTSGDFVWAQAFEGTGSTQPEGIDVGSDGSIYTSGRFSGTVDFDTGSGVSNVTAAGSNNTFIHKMREANFITQWNLATAGSGANQLSFGTSTSGTVSYTWQQLPTGTSGSGTWSGTTLTILGLPTGAAIRLDIAPTNFQRININNGGDRNRLTLVEQWGTTAWSSMSQAFYGCTNLQVTATDNPNLLSVTNMSYLFFGCTNLNSPSNIGSWNTAAVTNMSEMFVGASAFNQNMGAWSTGAVTNMNQMFRNASAFNQDIGAWTLNAVVNLGSMLDNSGMDCNNYSSTLLGWSANPLTPNNITLGAIGRQYGTNAVAARTSLIAKGWTISGDAPSGAVCSSGSTIIITTQPANFSACFGQTPTATFTTNATGTTNITYQWESQQVDFTFDDVVDGGAYSGANTPTLTVNTGVGPVSLAYRCRINGDFAIQQISNTASLLAIFPPPSPTTTGANRCGTGSVTLTASGGSNGQYRWYDAATGGTALSGEVNSAYTTPVLSTPTTYYVAINNGTCESTRTPVIATINATPAKPTIASSIAPSGSSVSVCSTNILTLSAPVGFTSYIWLPAGSTQQITAASSGTYSVVVTNAAGCSSVASDILTVTVIQAPCSNQPPVIASASGETQIEGKVSLDLVSLISDADSNIDIQSLKIKIQPTSGAKTSITANGRLELDYQGISFSGTDALTIEVCDLLGDCTQQEIKIEVIGDLNIYNAISPNGDGLNDFWIIQYIDVIAETKDNKVFVYNRWGDVIFETENYDNKDRAFKGLNKGGSELPSGTYFYKIEFASGRKSLTGYLSLKK